jgi:hypothetical protein
MGRPSLVPGTDTPQKTVIAALLAKTAPRRQESRLSARSGANVMICLSWPGTRNTALLSIQIVCF